MNATKNEPTILERLRAEMDLAAIERSAMDGPLSQRLAVMAGQVQGMAEEIATGLELTGATDAAELRSLAAALTAASSDAAKLESRISTRDDRVARWMADETTPTDREPDRDTDQAGNTWRNTDGEG